MMTAWILAIVGVICLSVLVDILLPNGQTNKYVKGIFSVITLYVIISPLPSFLSGGQKFVTSLNFDAADFSADENFLAEISLNPFKARETALAAYLSKRGYTGVTVKYVGCVENDTEIDYINIILSDESFDASTPHNVVSDNVKSLVADFTGADKEDIRVLYG